jgi:hypothetical protein
MNMKRAGIIFLGLIVWFCLANGAFAAGKGKYMVLYIEVESGNIASVCGADVIGSFGSNEEINVKVKKPKYHTNNENSDGKPLPIEDEISRTTYTTIFSSSSPGCRYIWYNGRYIKICN